MITTKSAWIAAALTAATLTTSAEAATYGFSFLNEDGAIAGTVTGLIEIADGDGLGLAATSVQVTSAPFGLGYFFFPEEFISASYTLFQNSFDVVGGAIVDGVFAATNTTEGLVLNDGITFLNQVGTANPLSGVADIDSSSLAFTPAAVPLPAGAVLLLTSIAGLGLARRRKT